jgi:hypothetical protein
VAGLTPIVIIVPAAHKIKTPKSGRGFWCHEVIDQVELNNGIHSVQELEEQVAASDGSFLEESSNLT